MTDKYVEVTTRSWGSRILDSFVGMFIGLVLILVAFIVLWVNEGRVDMSKVAARSVPVSASTVDPSTNGKLVAATGILDSAEQLGDPGYLKPGRYIQISRDVEMYAWIEHTKSETKKNVGGSETTTTEYTYEKGWTGYPADSSDFKIPDAHENPAMPLEAQTYTVQSAKVGAYTVDPQRISLPGGSKLQLNAGNVVSGTGSLQGSYLFIGKGSEQAPRVGDVRVSYLALPAGIEVTAFGQADGDRLVPYLYQGKHTLYSAYAGDRASAIESMAFEYTMIGWLLRIGGFLMMWFGLYLLLGPISTFLDVLPFLGNLSRGATWLVTLGVAFILSLATIIVSAIFHNLVLMLLLLVIVVAVAVRRSRQAAPRRAAA
ncbi:MAG: TMEM43 family protein [Ardenticatenaceae bacterium]|nr:TMEM43 family protein [Ardenticatenaceae bacterium]HBY95392.1 hypothetical protein [Chloroflexota bacterium]